MITKSRLLLLILIALALASPRLRADATGHAADDELALAAAQLSAQANPGAALATTVTVTIGAAVTAADSSSLGEWSSLINWTPHIPVSAANLPDGRVLTFASNQRTSFPAGVEFTYAATWNPATGAFQEFNNSTHDMFCGGITLMPDGRVMVNGGRNETPYVSIFDWRNNTWTRVQNMNGGRWYNTSVSLPNGNVFTATGSGTGQTTTERWTGTGWTAMTGIPWTSVIGTNAGYNTHWHPFLSLAPDGRLLHFGPTDTMHWFNMANTGSFTNTGTSVPGAHYPKEGCFVMYDEGKVLVAGGSINTTASAGDSTIGTSTNAAYTVDMTTSPPTVTPTASMQFARQFVNAVVLPTGEVLAIGGNSPGQKFSDTGSVLPCEIWSPSTGTWRTVGSIAVGRNYHSVALLLPDGRVYSGGGGLSGGAGDHQDAQLYTPPTLFTSTGADAVRPVLNTAPTAVAPSAVFSVTGTSGIAKFAFIRMAALTHSVNTDQRYLSLPFTETAAGSYDINMHANTNVVTPGYWMLFGVNASGAYSVAKVVKVDASAVITVAQPGNQTSNIGSPASLQMSATAPTGVTPTFSATGLPGGLTIGSANGLISGVPTESGVFNVRVTASGGGLSASQNFTWTVLLTNTGSGSILREWWTGITGVLVSNLTSAAAYPNSPTGNSQLTSFETPTDWADNMGQRVRGYIHPPVTGQYRFWIASDDEGQLFLSTSRDPGAKTLIANVPQWSSSREWTKFPEQQSAVITLQAGQSYYVEALMKEGGGGDNLAIAWATPGSVMPVVIAGQYLSPWVNNRAPLVTNPGARTDVVGSDVALQIVASDPDSDALTFSATGLPASLSINPATGLISGTLTTTGSNNTTVSVSDGRNAAVSVNFAWTVNDIVNLNQPSASPPKVSGSAVTFTASSTGGANVRYKWSWGDGTADSPLSTNTTASHTYAAPGRYLITLTATDDTGRITTATFFQGIFAPLTTRAPSASSSIIFEDRPTGTNDRVWCVNPDNNSVSVFDAVTRARLAETTVGTSPRALALAPDGRVWVTNNESGTVSIISGSTLAVVQTLTLPRGSRPFGIAFDPDGTDGWIVCEGTGQLLRMNPTTAAQVATLDVGVNARHISVSADGARVFVTRFITPQLPGENTATVSPTDTTGGETLSILTASLAIEKKSILTHSTRPDTINTGRGIPNYLGPAVISPDGLTAWVPSKQDNILRGMLRDGSQLTHDQTVRSVASRIVLTSGVPANTDDMPRRVDFDNAGIASNGAFERTGIYFFTALEGSREIGVVDVWNKKEIKRFAAGRAPQGVAVSPDGRTVFVQNFMDRTITVHDVGMLIDGADTNPALTATLNCITTERLAPNVLLGKKHFYDSADPRIAFQQYISCASCHNDGGQDGRTWDFTGFGEGLRNTIGLRGHGGTAQGPLHWTGNFDEVQDFENQLRGLDLGTGLIAGGDPHPPMGTPNAGRSADLDALASYVTSLSTQDVSPFRNADGSLTTAAVAGKAVFENANCAQCHSGAQFTNSALNVFANIGTIKPSTGQRLGAALTGLDVPTLRGLWATAPYLHDGTAQTLAAAVQAHQGVTLTTTELNNLVSYLQQIDGGEASAPVLGAPGMTLTGPATATGAFNVTITATQSVSGLTASDFTITNGTAGALTGGPSIYTVAVTPTAAGAVTISLPAGSCVNAINLGNTASNTLSVSYSTTPPPPTLTALDIGSVGVAGSTTLANGVYTINGSGADIYYNTDSFHFAYASLAGDGEIRARVTSQTNTASWAKAGVMFREDLSVGSRHGTTYVTPVETRNGFEMLKRTTKNGATTDISGPANNPVPNNWVRLVRTGNTIVGYASADGVTWTQIHSASYSSLASTMFVGLCVTSVDNTRLGTATFDNVQIIGTTAQPTAPAAPTNLAASAQSSSSIRLTWTDVSTNETGYRVERATGSGTFAEIASLAAGSLSFTDSGLAASTLYNYKVSAFNIVGAGTAGPVGATTLATSSGTTLIGADIGLVGVAGSTSLSSGVYTVKGSGVDIYYAQDSFHFASTSITGDGEIKARITSQTNTASWAKAGVMIRESRAVGSRHAIMYVTPYETRNGFEFMSRSATNGVTTDVSGPANNAPPNNWVRLVRSGNTIAGYASANGTTWTQVKAITLTSLPSNVMFGLCVTSANNSVLGTATFDNVAITGTPGAALSTTVTATLASLTSSTTNFPELVSMQSGSGSLGLAFTRPANSAARYELHLLDDLAQSPAGWRVATASPTIASNGDGTETVSYSDVTSLFTGADKGFARLHQEVDSDGDGFADSTKEGDTVGFTRAAYPVGTATAGVPFATPALGTAMTTGVSADSLTLDRAAPSFGGASCYLEVTRGVNEGQRFEIDEEASTGGRLVIEANAARSTLATLPSSLVGDTIAIRAHRTVSEMFPETLFRGTSQRSTADRLLFYNGSAFEALWLWKRADGYQQWTREDDATLANAGGRIIDETEGVLVQARSEPVNLTFSGIVRANAISLPLKAGTKLIANPWPGAQSATSLGMTLANGLIGSRNASSADQIHIWKGDAANGTAGYATEFLLNSGPLQQWTATGDASLTNLNDALLFGTMRAAFIKSVADKPSFVVPLVWRP
ncbi:MAG: DUF1349 domain-containing protein [Verrucomicrobiaceae bacterium]|nr:DUF1349 domain-containing protein [Verrucomicrobiaceae bacterium]